METRRGELFEDRTHQRTRRCDVHVSNSGGSYSCAVSWLDAPAAGPIWAGPIEAKNLDEAVQFAIRMAQQKLER